jgi:hypothetical protein
MYFRTYGAFYSCALLLTANVRTYATTYISSSFVSLPPQVGISGERFTALPPSFIVSNIHALLKALIYFASVKSLGLGFRLKALASFPRYTNYKQIPAGKNWLGFLFF